MSLPNNSQPVRILAIGADISRLSSGANLLTQAGYRVDAVLKIEDAVRRISKSRYHLAIVCSTFTYDEQISIRARLRQVRPQVPVLLLAAEHNSPILLLAAVASRLRTVSKLELVASRVPHAVDPKLPS
jgi:DNA-binding response OmpR family regulator